MSTDPYFILPEKDARPTFWDSVLNAMGNWLMTCTFNPRPLISDQWNTFAWNHRATACHGKVIV
jgi:hypothetical protein